MARDKGSITVTNLATNEKRLMTPAQLKKLFEGVKKIYPQAAMTAEQGKKFIVNGSTKLYRF